MFPSPADNTESNLSEEDFPKKKKGPFTLTQKLVAETFGTFVLTFVDAGASMAAVISGGEVNHLAKAIVPGLVVMAMIYTIGNVSGAHINPAVSFAFALRGVFKWKLLPLYWIAQITGAVAAACMLWFLLGPVENLGTTVPGIGAIPAFGMEILLTLFLVMVILASVNRHQVLGHFAAIPVGGIIAVCGLLGKSISGASMNPARSLGPALVSSSWDFTWIYIAGPFAGALLAVGLTNLIHGKANLAAMKAAQGAGKEK